MLRAELGLQVVQDQQVPQVEMVQTELKVQQVQPEQKALQEQPDQLGQQGLKVKKVK